MTSEVRLAKERHKDKLVSKINESNSTNAKVWWKIYKQLQNANGDRSGTLPPMLVGDNIVADCEGKACAFNEYFAEQCKSGTHDDPLPELIYSTDARISDVDITETSVNDVLKSLDSCKASGPDQIGPRLLKITADAITYPLTLIFRRS